MSQSETHVGEQAAAPVPGKEPVAAAPSHEDEAQKIWDEVIAKAADNKAADAIAESNDPGPKAGSDGANEAQNAPGDAAGKADASGKKGGTKADAKPDTVDIWQGATPEQLAEVNRLRQQASSANGRYTAAQRRVMEMERALNGTSNTEAVLKEAREATETLGKDYAEVAGPVGKVIDAISADIDARKRAGAETRAESINEIRAHVAEQGRILEERIPGWRQRVTGSPAEIARFRQWVDDQPRAIREAAARNDNKLGIVDADAAELVIGGYIRHMESMQPGGQPGGNQTQTQTQQQQRQTAPNDRRQRQLSASASPNMETRLPPTSEPQEDDREGWWNHYMRMEADKRKRA